MADPIQPGKILGVAEVRRLAKAKYASDLVRWRERNGFPEPIKVLPHTKSGRWPVELWDADEVRKWLRANERPIGRI